MHCTVNGSSCLYSGMEHESSVESSGAQSDGPSGDQGAETLTNKPSVVTFPEEMTAMQIDCGTFHSGEGGRVVGRRERGREEGEGEGGGRRERGREEGGGEGGGRGGGRGGRRGRERGREREVKGYTVIQEINAVFLRTLANFASFFCDTLL